jgi:hypothetical protein
VDPEGLLRIDGILPDDEVHVWQVDQLAWEKETALCSSYSIQRSESGPRASSFQNRAINL